MTLINIKEYTKQLKENYKQKVAVFEQPPQLAIIQVGNNEASNRYVRNKVKDCEEVGIVAHVYYYDNKIKENELIQEIIDLQDFYDGLIVQLPLPEHINQKAIVMAIASEKDVDGLRPAALYDPATPKGIMDYLRACHYDLVGKDVVIIGRSDLVGKPLARLMTAADATVTLCHSKSKLAPHIYHCDLIVVAVGKEKFLNCYSIHVPVIDVGINFTKEGKLVGDTFNTEDRNVTPVPGGVGLLTRCALLDNVIKAKERGQNNAKK